MISRASSEVLPPRVLLGAWCKAIFGSLARAGIRDVVISPGSRNTPLTLAALRNPELRTYSVIDERSAGFFALGLAKGSRLPVGLLCTSGTAGAHYYPALIEASYSDVPLVFITADRPIELQDCGAPQTIRQQGLYGSFVRAEAQTADPTPERPAFEQLAASVFSLATHCQKPRPGPVHLNVPLRKPLEPESPESAAQGAIYELLLQAAVTAPSFGENARPFDVPLVNDEFLKTCVSALASAERPLLVAGPLSPTEHRVVQDLAESWGVPFLSEYGSARHLRGLEFYPPLLTGRSAPDCIFHFGPPCVSSAWAQYLDAFRGRYLVASGTAFRDPARCAESVLVAGIDSAVKALRTAMPSAPQRAAQRAQWVSRLDEIQQQIDRSVHAALTSSQGEVGQSEPQAVHAFLNALTPGAELVLANSLALRLASWVWGAVGDSPFPHTVRGVNGIDGTVATAAGICNATQRPTALLIGDVALAHDIGSLALLRQLKQPFVLVLLDNAGGRLFDHLPARNTMPEDEFTYWTTKPDVDFELAVRAYGLVYEKVDEISQIYPALQQALHRGLPTALHLLVDPGTTLSFLSQVRKVHGGHLAHSRCLISK